LTDHVSAITEAWRAGLGLYMLGDNDPFFVEASQVLRMAGLPTMGVRSLVSTFVARGKADSAALRAALDDLMFDSWHGIPRAGSQRMVTLAGLVRALVPDAVATRMLASSAQLETLLGAADTLSDGHAALLAAWARHRTRGWDVSPVTALAQLVTSTAGRAVWDGCAAEEYRPLSVVGAIFDHCATVDGPPTVPPFATVLGPSVMRWCSGEWLADPTAADAGSLTWVAGLKLRRGQMFRRVYTSHDVNGYPTDTIKGGNARRRGGGPTLARALAQAPAQPAEVRTMLGTTDAVLADLTGDATCIGTEPRSGHCNLHRAVRSVLGNPEHADAEGCSEAVERDVAAYLLRDGKGNIFDPVCHDAVPALVESFLRCQARIPLELTASAAARMTATLGDHVAAELLAAVAQWKELVASGATPSLVVP